MIRCYITDRHALGGTEALLRNARLVAGRVDWIQVREKDLPSDELLALTRELMTLGPRVIVNSNLDVALRAGAAGVHLPFGAPLPAAPGLLVGVSCHSVREVRVSAKAGAGYVLLSPIFPSLSKPGYGPALGLVQLAEACAAVPVPVLALGGVDEARAAACVAAGAAGYAAISEFQR